MGALLLLCPSILVLPVFPQLQGHQDEAVINICSFNCPAQNPPVWVRTVQRCPQTLSLVSTALPHLTSTRVSPPSLPGLQGLPVRSHPLLTPSCPDLHRLLQHSQGMMCSPSAQLIPPPAHTHTRTYTCSSFKSLSKAQLLRKAA